MCCIVHLKRSAGQLRTVSVSSRPTAVGFAAAMYLMVSCISAARRIASRQLHVGHKRSRQRLARFNRNSPVSIATSYSKYVAQLLILWARPASAGAQTAARISCAAAHVVSRCSFAQRFKGCGCLHWLVFCGIICVNNLPLVNIGHAYYYTIKGRYCQTNGALSLDLSPSALFVCLRAIAPRAVVGLHSRAAATYRRAERAVSDGATATPRAVAHWCAVVDAAQGIICATARFCFATDIYDGYMRQQL